MKSREVSVEAVLSALRGFARSDQLEGMARYGMAVEGRLGVNIPVLRKMAKNLGRDHALALKLWESEIAEARILAAMIADPTQLTEVQMEAWVQDFNSWDVCDQVCLNLFDKTPFAWDKVRQWATRSEEFVKRAAFALIACLAWHNAQASDDAFIQFIPLIVDAAQDERNYVKKSVSWALRQIGKRNLKLHQIAIHTAEELAKSASKSARWIASDVLKDLTRLEVHERLVARELGSNA